MHLKKEGDREREEGRDTRKECYCDCTTNMVHLNPETQDQGRTMDLELSFPMSMMMGMVIPTSLIHWLGDALGQVPSLLILP